MVIATVFSRPQLNAILAKITKEAKDVYGRELGHNVPGRTAWELLDYGDVVVHVLTADQRDFYDLVRGREGGREKRERASGHGGARGRARGWCWGVAPGDQLWAACFAFPVKGGAGRDARGGMLVLAGIADRSKRPPRSSAPWQESFYGAAEEVELPFAQEPGKEGAAAWQTKM